MLICKRILNMKRFLSLFLAIVFFSFVAVAQSESDGDDIFSALVGIVLENDPVDDFDEIPEDSDYGQPLIDAFASDVLDYLSGVYKDHGFYESGGWAKTSPLKLSRPDKKNPHSNLYANQPDLTARMRVYTPKITELPDFITRDFSLPIRGRLTSRYGYRPKFGRMHKGIDVSLHIGDTVRVALPGVVSKVAYEAKGYGNYVVVSHADGYETRYAHMTRAIVAPGQSVKPGQAVGLGGSTGNSTGPHLHFEIRCNGQALDPLTCFGLSEIYKP